MHVWYTSMCVRVKWKGTLRSSISVREGTRQGGLSSPFLFNILYLDLIEELNNINAGSYINDINYNVFCYADDIMLSSLIDSGLQTLVSAANR